MAVLKLTPFCVLLALPSGAGALTLISSAANQDSLRSAAAQKQRATVTIPSGFFGDFSEAESTYTTEGLDASSSNPIGSAAWKYGREPTQDMEGDPFANPELFKSQWFHESVSGGPAESWHADYPSLEATEAGNHEKQTPDFSPGSSWVQDYKPMVKPSKAFPQFDAPADGPSQAVWFDNSLQQIDGFGRSRMPDERDGRWYLSRGWQERSVNTTITCKEPGCTGQADLHLFDGKAEEATLCRLSIHVHPTDYDVDDEREYIESWRVNNQTAVRQCSPKARGCLKADAPVPLFPCISSLNVDKVVDSSGKITIEGKNSHFVDECPHQGNLLSGVAIATCMVRNKSAAEESTDTVTPESFFDMSTLSCQEPGCTASTSVAVMSRSGRKDTDGKKLKCTMNVSVIQTDFDVPEEHIVFIEVAGKNVTSAPLNPGKNPCNLMTEGQNVTQADRVYTALLNYDVTNLIQTGLLSVKGKISDMVDDCAFQGDMFHANVSVLCA